MLSLLFRWSGEQQQPRYQWDSDRNNGCSLCPFHFQRIPLHPHRRQVWPQLSQQLLILFWSQSPLSLTKWCQTSPFQVTCGALGDNSTTDSGLCRTKLIQARDAGFKICSPYCCSWVCCWTSWVLKAARGFSSLLPCRKTKALKTWSWCWASACSFSTSLSAAHT